MFNRTITFVFTIVVCMSSTTAYAQNVGRGGVAACGSAAPTTVPVTDVEEPEIEMKPLTPVGAMNELVVAFERDPLKELRRGNADDDRAPRALTGSGGTGATTQPRPTLYFYLPKSTDKPVVATLNHGDKTLKQWMLSGHAAAGVYAAALSESDPPLEVSDDYEWFVEVREHYPDSRTRNPKVVSTLSRVPADRAPQIGPGADPTERVVGLARAGLIYDAVDTLLRAPLPSLHKAALLAAPSERDALRNAWELKRNIRLEQPPLMR